MRLLLDTHIALWAIAGVDKLSERAKTLISAPQNEISVSIATIWEIAIKYPLARRRVGAMPVSSSEALELFRSAGFELLQISAQHAVAVEDLPPLHGDPFDRMLVAQALSEPMHLLTADAQVAAYDDAIIRV
jgi:PIN domain nuclease of toxin-antitoxin system